MKPKSALRERLEAAVMERHCANHPLTEKWAAGKLSRNALMGWGIEQYHWISNIYRGELFKAANTPLEVQRLLLENYLEETDPRVPIWISSCALRRRTERISRRSSGAEVCPLRKRG